MKQGTLSFASSKRGSTASGKAKALKASPSVTAVKPPGSENRAPGSRTASLDSTISIGTSNTDATSEDDVVLIGSTLEQRSAKRRKMENAPAKASGGMMKPKILVDDSDSTSDEEEPEPVDLGVLEKAPQVQRLYKQAKVRMGDVPPVHAEKQTKIHHILRVFDTSYEYGPCVGMTRLERWERAHALGLNPPAEVREILMSKQAKEDDMYKQCVFYDDV